MKESNNEKKYVSLYLLLWHVLNLLSVNSSLLLNRNPGEQIHCSICIRRRWRNSRSDCCFVIPTSLQSCRSFLTISYAELPFLPHNLLCRVVVPSSQSPVQSHNFLCRVVVRSSPTPQVWPRFLTNIELFSFNTNFIFKYFWYIIYLL